MKVKTIPIETNIVKPINLTAKKESCFTFLETFFKQPIVNIQVCIFASEHSLNLKSSKFLSMRKYKFHFRIQC